MINTQINDDATILVEFSATSGLRQVSAAPTNPEELAQKSTVAVNTAMTTVREMARRTSATIATLANKPNHVELSFGIKFTAEAGAVIAKTGTEASINVKLVWGEPQGDRSNQQ